MASVELIFKLFVAHEVFVARVSPIELQQGKLQASCSTKCKCPKLQSRSSLTFRLNPWGGLHGPN